MKLATYLGQWNRKTRIKRVGDNWLGEQARNVCWVPTSNLYREYDIGLKNVVYPDGQTHRVKARKVRDTAGTTFYSFDLDTPLNLS